MPGVKKILPLMLACILSGCYEQTPPAAAPQPAPTARQASEADPAAALPADAPVILVATEANEPPFDFKDKDGSVIGFDADIIRAAAAAQGMKVNIIHTQWEGILEGLNKQSYQLVMGALGDSPERRKKYALSKSYANAPNIIAVPHDSPIRQFKDIHGKRVAMLADTIVEKDLYDRGVNVQKTAVNSTYMLLKELMQGKVDAVAADKLILAYTAKSIPDAPKLNIIPILGDDESGVVFAAAKNNGQLISKINDGLDSIRKNGTYDRIYKKWFGNAE